MERELLDIERTAIELVMNDDMSKKRQLAKKISDVATRKGIYPSSIYSLYKALGKGKFGGFTVPAINL